MDCYAHLKYLMVSGPLDKPPVVLCTCTCLYIHITTHPHLMTRWTASHLKYTSDFKKLFTKCFTSSLVTSSITLCHSPLLSLRHDDLMGCFEFHLDNNWNHFQLLHKWSRHFLSLKCLLALTFRLFLRNNLGKDRGFLQTWNCQQIVTFNV